MTVKTSSPQTRVDDEPRFRSDPEPKNKTAYVTMKQEVFVWDGKAWELLSVRHGDVATSNITMEIARWMKTDEYKKLRDRKKK